MRMSPSMARYRRVMVIHQVVTVLLHIGQICSVLLMIRNSHGLDSGSLCPLSRFGTGVLIRYKSALILVYTNDLF